MNTKWGFFVYCFLIAGVAQGQSSLAVVKIKMKSSSISSATVSDSTGILYTAEITPSTRVIDPEKEIYTSLPNKNVYVSKKDAKGNVLWKRQLRGLTDYNYSEPAISRGPFGDIYVTYNRQTSGNIWSSFIVRLDTNGDIVWTKCLGGSDTGGINVRSISVSNNKLNVTGYFWGTIGCDTSKGFCNLVSENQPGVFACKMDTEGNYLWIRGVERTDSSLETAAPVQASVSEPLETTTGIHH